jgi:hypothetical protein
MDPGMSVQLGCRMQDIGFPITGASPTGAKVLNRVERHVRSGDAFPGALCSVQQVKGDYETVLEHFLAVLATDLWDGSGDGTSEPGLNFTEEQVFCGWIHRHGF